MVRKVHVQRHSVFLFCSIIIPRLLSSKSELQFPCFVHTLALNFKDWTFGVILTRHFRPKSRCLNGRVYCKPIDVTSKMLFIEGRTTLCNQLFLSYWSYWLLDKKETNITKLWKYFPQKNFQKVSKVQFWKQWLYIFDKIIWQKLQVGTCQSKYCRK